MSPGSPSNNAYNVKIQQALRSFKTSLGQRSSRLSRKLRSINLRFDTYLPQTP